MSNDFDEDDFDDEYYEADWDEEGEEFEPPVRVCPECGAEVFGDLDMCPSCGHWLEAAPRPLDGKPTWYLLLGLLGVIAVIIVVSGLGHLL